MPQYKVGVTLSATTSRFRSAFKAAAGETRKARSALRAAGGEAKRMGSAFRRAAGAARSLGATTGDSARRTATAFRRAAGAPVHLGAAIRNVTAGAGRMASSIVSGARRSARGVSRLIDRYRALGRAQREADGATLRTAKRAGKWALTGVGGVGAFEAARGEIGLERRLIRLGAASRRDGESNAEMRARMVDVRRQVEAVAMRDDIRVPVGDLLGALESYQRLTGQFDDAMAGLEAIAMMIQSSGANDSGSPEDIGRLAGHYRKLGITTNDDLRAAFAMTMASEDRGAVGAREIAAIGGETISTWAAMRAAQGMSTEESLRELLALTQVAFVGTGDENTAKTAIKAVVASLRDARKLEHLQQLGVRDAATRNPIEVIQEAIQRTRHDPTLLTPIFDVTAQDVVNAFGLAEGRATYQNVKAGTRDVEAATQRWELNVAAIAETTQAALDQAGDRIRSAIGRVSDALDARPVVAGAIEAAPAALTTLAAAGGAAWLFGGVRRFWRAVRGRKVHPGGAPSQPGGLLDVAAGPGAGVVRRMTVGTLVVRGGVVGGGPGGMFGGRRTGRTPGRPQARGRLGLLQRLAGMGRGLVDRVKGGARMGVKGAPGLVARTAGTGRGLLAGAARRLPWIGAALAGGAAALHAARGEWAQAGREGAMAGGALAGAAGGAAIGTAIFPGVGTAIGGLGGALLGGVSAERIFGKIWDPAAAGEAPEAESADPDRPRRSARADVRAQEFAARPMQAVDNRRIDRSIHITLHAPPGADAEEIARLVAEEVDRVNRRRDQEREDSLRAVVADRPRMVFRY